MTKAGEILAKLGKLNESEKVAKKKATSEDAQIKFFTVKDLGDYDQKSEAAFKAPKFVIRKGKKVMLSAQRRRNLERLAKAPDKPGYMKRFSKALNKVVYTRITSAMKVARRKLNLKLHKGAATRKRAKSMAISRRLRGV